MAQLLTPGSILAMTDQAADRLIKLDSGDAALLYLHLLRRGSPEGLRWPEERKRAALKQLQDQGLASLSLTAAPAAPEEPPEAPPPEYALEDINAALGDRLRLPRPGRRGGAAAGQEAHRQRFEGARYFI